MQTKNELTLPLSINDLTRMRATSISLDVSQIMTMNLIKRESLEKIAMASTITNGAITMNFKSLDEFYSHVKEIFSHPSPQ